VRRDFKITAANAAAVGEVCRLVDGLPLAIQLAAARVRLFSPSALVDRLGDRLALLTSNVRDVPERHRTIRSMIDWSYALLNPQERDFFRDFAVFSAGARLDSVPPVLAPHEDPVALVTALVNHSLVVQQEDFDGQPRFRMLQTIRDYAVALLKAEPEQYAAVAERHAQHYLARVEELMPPGERARREASEHVQADYGNVRAALSFWLEEHGDANPDAPEKALRMAAAMGHHWYRHGQSREGSVWLERALAKAPPAPSQAKGRALLALAIMNEQRQELDLAADLLTRAREVYQSIGDRAGEARCLNGAGIVADSAGRIEDALPLLQSAVSTFEEVGDIGGRADALDSLGTAYLHQGDWEGARDIFRDNLVRDTALGNGWDAACTALNLALADLLGGQVDEARTHVRESMDTFTEWHDPNGVIETLEAAVGIAVAAEQHVAAARLIGAVDRTRSTLGLRGSPPDRHRVQAWATRVREKLGSAAFDAAAAEGAAMTYDQAAGYARDEVLRRGTDLQEPAPTRTMPRS
jgi:non-specific serine/threonine protein kinase